MAFDPQVVAMLFPSCSDDGKDSLLACMREVFGAVTDQGDSDGVVVVPTRSGPLVPAPTLKDFPCHPRHKPVVRNPIPPLGQMMPLKRLNSSDTSRAVLHP